MKLEFNGVVIEFEDYNISIEELRTARDTIGDLIIALSQESQDSWD